MEKAGGGMAPTRSHKPNPGGSNPPPGTPCPALGKIVKLVDLYGPLLRGKALFIGRDLYAQALREVGAEGFEHGFSVNGVRIRT